jgi:beta-lactamase regulating signal transducer with metallopeptidase domain
MTAAAHAWWRWTESMSIQVALLVLVVALAERCLVRRAWPQLGAMLWLVVLCKLVVPPTLSSPLSISRLWAGVTIAPAATTGTGAAGWAPVLFWTWAIGLVLFATLALRRVLALRRWSNGPSLPTGSALRARSQRIARRLGLPRPPPVRVLADAKSPVLVGFFRPQVVLTPELARNGGARLDHVLLHEFCHVKRRDSLASFACLLVQLVYWFHPLVWLAARRLATWREICCDQAVARNLDGPAPYRRTLLDLSRPLLERPAPRAWGRLDFIHAHSQLLARLEWLDRPPARSHRLHPAATALCFCVFLLCCVPLARPPQPPTHAQVPALEDLEGCMQLRFAVLAQLAQSRSEIP